MLFERRLKRLEQWGMVELKDDTVVPTSTGAPRLRLLADLLVNFVEAYASATESLGRSLRGRSTSGSG